jgi:hypothetical protein
MERKCFVPDCKMAAEMICFCDFEGMCDGHLALHQRRAGNHSYVSVSFQVDKISEDLIFDSLFEHYSYLVLIKKKINSEAQLLIKEILKKTQENIKKIESLEEGVLRGIHCFRNKERKSVLEDYLNNLAYLPIRDIENEIANKWNFPIISQETRKILPQIETLFKLETIGLPYNLKENKYLYFFADNSVVLNSFNAKKRNIQAFRFPLKSERGSSASLCFLPSKKMFYGGGQVKNKTIAQYLIIDETSGEIVEIKGGIARRQAGCCYLNGYVYLFGGCEGDRAFKSSEKLNLLNKKWESLPDLPQSSDTSVTSLNNQIFLTGGRQPNLLNFNPNFQKYLSLLENLDLKNKFLCNCEGRLYLFTERKLFISSSSSPHIWSSHNLSLSLGKYWISSWIVYKNHLFFTTGHYHFFDNTWAKAKRLNLSTLELQEII